MASEMNITQDFRKLTLTLPADTVTVNLDVKTLKGEYMYTLTNNYTDLPFNPWSADHEPSEMFLKIVREMQIEPNSYYLETVISQSLVNNFALNYNRPQVMMVEQEAPQETDKTNRQCQSPCSSNWSDYLEVANDTDDENADPVETTAEPNQPSTSAGTHVPQDLQADANATVRLPRSLLKAKKFRRVEENIV